jgi:hypothetical protein
MLPPAFACDSSSLEHRVKSVVTSQRQWRGIARARRRVARTRFYFSSPRCPGRGRERSERVTGRLRGSEPSGNAPSPQPSPRTRGEGSATTRRENAILFPSRPRAQRVVGRGAGGLRPPCFFNSTPMRSIGYGWGDFLTRPPTPAHSLTRISPTLPTASGGRGRRSAAQRRRVVEGACGTHYS